MLKVELLIRHHILSMISLRFRGYTPDAKEIGEDADEILGKEY